MKQELAMHATLASRGKVNYDSYTPEQQYDIQRLARQFMEEEIEDIEELSSMRQVRELFVQMKNVYVSLLTRAKTIKG